MTSLDPYAPPACLENPNVRNCWRFASTASWIVCALAVCFVQRKMTPFFAEFEIQLPIATTVALSGWVPLSIGFAGIVVAVQETRMVEGGRRTAFVAANTFLLGMVIGYCLVCFYMPLTILLRMS